MVPPALSSAGTTIASFAPARPVRVLHVASHLDIKLGGSIWATFQIAASAHGPAIQCEVAGTVMPGSDTAGYFRRTFPGIKVHEFACHFPRHNFASVGLLAWLLRHAADYDVIHVHQIFHWPFIYAWWAARLRRRPLVVSPHNSLDPADLTKHSRVKHLVYGPLVIRPALAGAVLLCTAEKELSRAVTFGAKPAPRPLAIPLPVADPSLEPVDPGAFRRRHSIPADAFTVLFLSRIDPKKGLDLLVEAFSRLRAVRPGAVLAIVGAGDAEVRRKCEKLAARLGVSASVRWCGFADGPAKAAAFRESDVYVLPSHYENFALAVIEAMWTGLPVLTTTGVFIADTLAEQGACLVCAPETLALTEGLLRLAGDDALREQFSRRSREVAATLYSAAAVRPLYEELYKDVATRIRPRNFH